MHRDYKEEWESFENNLFYNNFSKKILNGNEKEICDIISNFQVGNIKITRFNSEEIKKLFLSSIKDLGNDTKDYFNKVLPNIKIVKSKYIETGYAEIIGNSKKQNVYITNKKMHDMDFIACCHEFGHIPYLQKGANGDYFEYSEILSIFFEYLACLYLYKQDAYNIFLNQRLKISKDEANSYLELCSEDCFENKYHYYFLEDLKRDNLKYILSLDYALKLIDFYNNNIEEIKNLIDSIICGFSSFKLEKDRLGIDDNCNTLIKKLKTHNL